MGYTLPNGTQPYPPPPPSNTDFNKCFLLLLGNYGIKDLPCTLVATDDVYIDKTLIKVGNTQIITINPQKSASVYVWLDDATDKKVPTDYIMVRGIIQNLELVISWVKIDIH